MATHPNTGVIRHLRRAKLLRDGAGLTDGNLLEAFVSRRDGEALGALVRRHGPMVWGVCRRLLNHHDAEDAFQATFLVLVRRAASITSRELVANWLYGVAHQTSLKARAMAAKRKSREKQVPVMPEPPAAEHDLRPDVRPVLDQELSRLPEIYRAVLVLCDLEGRTRKEVAGQLGVPDGTVAGRLARARAMLAKRLARRGVVLSGGALAGALAHLAAAGVPPSVVSSTITAASVYAAGRATGSIVSANVATLTERVVRAMAVSKLKVATTVLLVAVLGGATGLVCRTLAGEPGAPPGPATARGGPGNASKAGAAPAPRDDPPGEGRIVLWREGHPLAIAPGTKETAALVKGYEGKRGALMLGPDGKLLIYVSNRDTTRPVDPAKQDRLYLWDGRTTTEIKIGVSQCHAFWGSDGKVYGYGLALPKWGDPEPPVDLTKDFRNWSFDPRTGKGKVLKLPGNVSVLNLSPDGKTFLVLHYTRAGGTPADYRLGLLPADGGEFVPLTRFGESTPGDWRFSPDGRSALGRMYRTVRGLEFPDLVVIDLKARTRTVVMMPKDARVGAACWSPDGKRIAFVWESQVAFAERNRVLPGPVYPGQEKKPRYTVTVARPDGSDATDVYTEAEYAYGSIDWGAASAPLIPARPGDPPGTADRSMTLTPRVVPPKGAKGTNLLAARLTLNDHGVQLGCRVYSAGIEVENLSGRAATVHFDPKDLKLELLDADGKVIDEAGLPRSGPAPMAHAATLPTSGYVGLSTYRGGIGLTPKSILFAAGFQDWTVKPGTYRLRGTVTVTATFGDAVLDPGKPEASDRERTVKVRLELAERRFELTGR